MNQNNDNNRKIVVAIDGGGTKTRLIIGDDRGRLLADITGAGSNHQICGVQGTLDAIVSLLDEALQVAAIGKKQIDYAVLGLAGADMPEDFEMLRKLLQPAFAGIDFDIVNDAWIIMRAGLPRSVGAVCICGTGTNAAAENDQGDKAILRSLDYLIGSYGGGGDIAAEALHYAFRADEKTGDSSKLTKELPSLFGVDSLAEIIPYIYPRLTEEAIDKMNKISQVVFRLANEGDRVCQDILIDMGKVLGKMVSGVIERTGQSRSYINVVMGGRVLTGDSPLIRDALALELHKKVPHAELIKSWLPPVAGAWLMALDKLDPHNKHSSEVKAEIEASFL